MTQGVLAEDRNPISNWFHRSGRTPPQLQYEIRLSLLDGLFLIRTDSFGFFAYLKQRCRYFLARNGSTPDVAAEIYCLQGSGWPIVNPGKQFGTMRTKKSEGVFHSFCQEELTCTWQSPVLMGCANQGNPSEIRIVARTDDPRNGSLPPDEVHIKCTRDRVAFADVWDLALCLYARVHGVGIIHGAVLGKKDRGILIIGESGSGKTTASLALVRDGYRLLTDEYAALWKQGRHRGSFSGVLVPPMFVGTPPRSLSGLEETMGMASPTKTPFDLASSWVRRTPVELQAVIVLVCPKQRIPEHRAVPMDPFDLLSCLMSQLLDPIHGDREALMEALVGIAETVPACRVTVGSDLSTFSEFVEQLASG